MNLLSPLPDARAGEVAAALLTRPGLRIERIVSLGQASPPGFWYDQDEGEWVVLLTGAARLRFADEGEDRLLAPGDWLDIAPIAAIASRGPTPQRRRCGSRFFIRAGKPSPATAGRGD